MPKRKFALRSLFAGRTGRGAKAHEIEDWASDSDEFNDAHPFDPSEVNRPPKLDNRTEAELRKACAIIVENLKPSGHDLEDTRMQSDILVDNPEMLSSNRASHPQKNVPGAPGGSTWYHEESTRSSQNIYPHNVVKSTDKPVAPDRTSGPPPDYETVDQHTLEVPKAEQGQVARPIEHTESPLAPLATEVVQSPNVASPTSRRVTETKALAVAQNGSSSSMSNYAPSDNGIRPSSTGATSTDYTPSPTSKQESGLARSESSRTAVAAAAAGAWRKRQAEEMYSQTDDLEAETAGSSIPQPNGLPHSEREISEESYNNTSTLGTDTTSGTLNGPFEQPSYVQGGPDESDGHDLPPGSNRGVSFQDTAQESTSSERTSDASKLAEAYQRSIEEPSTVVTNGDENRSSLKPKRLSKRFSKEGAPSRLKTQGQPSAETNSINRALSPTSSTLLDPPVAKPPESWPIPPKPRYSVDGVPSIPPLPDKHQFDDSIVVKDFYQPNAAPRPKSALQKSVSSDRRPVRPGDVEAADFDSFMSVVEEKGDEADGPKKVEPAAQEGSSVEEVSPPTSPSVSASKSENDNVASEQSPATSAARETSEGDVSPPEAPESPPPTQASFAQWPVSNGHSAEQRPVSQPLSSPPLSSRPHSEPSPVMLPPPPPPLPAQSSQREQRQALSPPIVSPRSTDQPSPVIVTSSRTSISASLGPSVPPHSRSQSFSNKKSPGGFKRILSKFGNSNRGALGANGYAPSKQKVVQGYAPGAYIPGYGFNGGIEEDEEWFDEQACAAPVVGFGRGW